ncbi:MAG: hypothetical protein ABFS12_18070 [Bacteroidota bacterium]
MGDPVNFIDPAGLIGAATTPIEQNQDTSPHLPVGPERPDSRRTIPDWLQYDYAIPYTDSFDGIIQPWYDMDRVPDPFNNENYFPDIQGGICITIPFY